MASNWFTNHVTSELESEWSLRQDKTYNLKSMLNCYLSRNNNDNNIGARVCIPRIILSPSEHKWPFILKREKNSVSTALQWL